MHNWRAIESRGFLFSIVETLDDRLVHCRCLLISVTDKCLVNKHPKPVLLVTPQDNLRLLKRLNPDHF